MVGVGLPVAGCVVCLADVPAATKSKCSISLPTFSIARDSRVFDRVAVGVATD